MLQTSISKGKINEGVLLAEFSSQENNSISCERNSSNKSIFQVNLKNTAWGVRIQQVRIKFFTDTGSVRLCRGIISCSASGEILSFNIPQIQQQYWAGEAKTLTVRICLPENFDKFDFNVTCKIEADIISRSQEYMEITTLSPIESNMYIQLI